MFDWTTISEVFDTENISFYHCFPSGKKYFECDLCYFPSSKCKKKKKLTLTIRNVFLITKRLLKSKIWNMMQIGKWLGDKNGGARDG